MYPNRECEHTFLVVAEVYDGLKDENTFLLNTDRIPTDVCLMKVIILACLFFNLLRLA
jgi:hypothetical protein